jgi:hypothetical protein
MSKVNESFHRDLEQWEANDDSARYDPRVARA